MGFFDRLMGKKQEAPKTEKKLPPAIPDQREGIVKKEEKIIGLRPDAQYVTTKEANQFLADKFQDLSKDVDAHQKAGLPTKKLDVEYVELKTFREKIDARLKSPDAVSQIEAGQAVLVENPWFQTESEEKKEDEEQPDIEGQRKKLDDLVKERDELIQKRDQLMVQVKKTVSTPKEWEIDSLQKHADVIDKPPVYPEYFSGTATAANTANEMRSRADKLEDVSKSQRRELSEPLREILDQLDDVEIAITAQQKNVQFLEKKYGSADQHEAA